MAPGGKGQCSSPALPLCLYGRKGKQARSTVTLNANSRQPLSTGLLTPAPLKQSNLVSEQEPSLQATGD